jgi:hypothetical protein
MLADSMVLDRLQARVIRDGQLYEADIPLAAAPSTVPEPATLGLTLTGAALLAAGATTRRLAGRRFTRR